MVLVMSFLPSDCLRVLGLDAYNSDYKVEGRKFFVMNNSIKIII